MTLQSYTVVDVALGTPEPPGLDRSVRMYVADEVDARLAVMQKQMTEMREMHAVSIADAEDRLALTQRAVDWCLSNGAHHQYAQQNWNDESSRYDYAWEIQVASGNPVPAEFADIIKPENSNGTV